MPANHPTPPATPARFPLSEFAGPLGVRRFRYEPGEHVTILGPTGWGKTHLAYRLLDAVATQRIPAMVLVIKPRDRTALRWSRDLDMPRVHDWPLIGSSLRRRRRGYTIWPQSTKDPDRDDLLLYDVMRNSLRDAYAKGRKIVFTDEAAGLADLRPPTRGGTPLVRYMEALWMRGRSLEAGVWAASQRPVDVPLHAYTQATHLFLGKDRDARGRARYAEISGVDPELVKFHTNRLEKWHWLYIRADGRVAIVTPD